MKKLLTLALAIALGTSPIAVAFVWAVWPVHRAVTSASSRLNGVLDGVNGTLVNVNRPCKGPASPDACGTLAQINKTSIAAGDIVNQSRIQVQQTGALITATTIQMSSVGADVADLVDSLKGTATAATGAVDQLQTDLAVAQPGLAAVKPLLDASTKTVQDADAGVTKMSPDLARFMKSSADGMDKLNVGIAQGNGVVTDIHKMTTHLEGDVDQPTPWWKKAIPIAGDAASIFNCIRGGGCRTN